MEQKPINYKDVLELGFVREDSGDTVWYAEYGWDYFTMEMKLSKRILASWDVIDHTVQLLRIDKDHSIVHRVLVEDLEHLKLYIGLFKEVVEPFSSQEEEEQPIRTTITEVPRYC